MSYRVSLGRLKIDRAPSNPTDDTGPKVTVCLASSLCLLCGCYHSAGVLTDARLVSPTLSPKVIPALRAPVVLTLP